MLSQAVNVNRLLLIALSDVLQQQPINYDGEKRGFLVIVIAYLAINVCGMDSEHEPPPPPPPQDGWKG